MTDDARLAFQLFFVALVLAEQSGAPARDLDVLRSLAARLMRGTTPSTRT